MATTIANCHVIPMRRLRIPRRLRCARCLGRPGGVTLAGHRTPSGTILRRPRAAAHSVIARRTVAARTPPSTVGATGSSCPASIPWLSAGSSWLLAGPGQPAAREQVSDRPEEGALSHHLQASRKNGQNAGLPARALPSCRALRRVLSPRRRNPRTSGGFAGGRYWARTSDPQLVDTGQPFAPVRSSGAETAYLQGSSRAAPNGTEHERTPCVAIVAIAPIVTSQLAFLSLPGAVATGQPIVEWVSPLVGVTDDVLGESFLRLRQRDACRKQRAVLCHELPLLDGPPLPRVVPGPVDGRSALRRDWGLPREVVNTSPSRWTSARLRRACLRRCAPSSSTSAGSMSTVAALPSVLVVSSRSSEAPSWPETVSVPALRSRSRQRIPSASETRSPA